MRECVLAVVCAALTVFCAVCHLFCESYHPTSSPIRHRPSSIILHPSPSISHQPLPPILHPSSSSFVPHYSPPFTHRCQDAILRSERLKRAAYQNQDLDLDLDADGRGGREFLGTASEGDGPGPSPGTATPGTATPASGLGDGLRRILEDYLEIDSQATAPVAVTSTSASAAAAASVSAPAPAPAPTHASFVHASSLLDPLVLCRYFQREEVREGEVIFDVGQPADKVSAYVRAFVRLRAEATASCDCMFVCLSCVLWLCGCVVPYICICCWQYCTLIVLQSALHEEYTKVYTFGHLHCVAFSLSRMSV